MFGRAIELFQLCGFRIRVDPSWFIVVALVTWSLGAPPEGWFPATLPGLGVATYWVMGAIGALGLFASIVLHELAHALTARRFGVSMRGITLFIFGGVAEMGGEPPSPRAEFLVAVAGPAASVAISAGCWGLGLAGRLAGWPEAIGGVVAYLALINGVLVVFNMIPAFPLDGGRVLRSALWRWRGDLRWATRLTSRIGAGFGIALVALGAVAVAIGSFIGGVWWILIGFFLRHAARMSYRNVVTRGGLEDEPVSRFMRTDPITVARSLSVEELVGGYVYKYQHRMFPVVDGELLLGCVTTNDISALPRDEWHRQSVGAITRPCSGANTIPPAASALTALGVMNRHQSSRLLVVDHGRLAGIVTLKDLLGFLALKLELEG